MLSRSRSRSVVRKCDRGKPRKKPRHYRDMLLVIRGSAVRGRGRGRRSNLFCCFNYIGGGGIVHYRGKFNLKRFFGGGLCTPALKFDPLVFGQCMTLSSRSRSAAVAVAVNIRKLPRTAIAVVATVTTANLLVRFPRFFPVAVPRFAVRGRGHGSGRGSIQLPRSGVCSRSSVDPRNTF